MVNLSPEKQTSWSWIEANRKRLSDFHLRIWGYAETAWREYRSAAAYCDLLRAEGFTVEEGSGEMPTAFVATWGSGGPVLGTYAEYDAVPGHSQQPVPYRAPREGLHPWAPGHTDPHSSLGTSALIGRPGRKGGHGAPRTAGDAAALRRACGEGVRLQARPRRQGLPGRRRRLHLLSPPHDEHDHLGHALRRLLERRHHLRVPGAGAVGRPQAVGLAGPAAHRAPVAGGHRRAVPHVHHDQVHQRGHVPTHGHVDAQRVHHGGRPVHVGQSPAAHQPDPVRVAIADAGDPGADRPSAGAECPTRRSGHGLPPPRCAG